jgi:putative aldouronate transport system substrate-binding protein
MSKSARTTAAAMGIMLLASACGSGSSGSPEASSPASSGASPASGSAAPAAQLPPVELTWYYPQPSLPAAVKVVEAEVNKITKSKINATVKLVPAIFGDYTQKMNTVVASGEAADIIWTSNWNFDYVQNQSKGAFIALDELIDKYAPEVKKSMPSFVWDATKIDGKIYGVPNYQIVINKEGFTIQKRYIDKYQIDVSKLKKPQDIEPLLAQIKANEKDAVPLAIDRNGLYKNMARTFNQEIVIANIGVINLNDPAKVLNQYETPEYKQYLDMMRDWFKKGYINEDAAVLKSLSDLQKAGKASVGYHNVLKPGGETEAKATNNGQEITYVPLTEAYSGTNTIITTMQAVSRNSKNPERALMLINLVNTDKALYNLLAFGIEGTHYTKVSEGVISPVKDSGYNSQADWVFGNVFNGYLLEGKDPKVPEETRKMNETAKPSPIMGFKFKADAVSTEIANISSVVSEYTPGLNTGTIDPESKLAEFQQKLKTAGIDKVIAEAQKQLDAWKSGK